MTSGKNFIPLHLQEARDTKIGKLPLTLKYTKDVPLEIALTDLKELNIYDLLTRGGGGVLIRGLPTKTPEAISSAIKCLGVGEQFSQLGASGKRSTLASELQTSNEGPKTLRMWQHNERARYTTFPTHIIFSAYRFTPLSGGRTPICSSIEVFERIEKELPEFLDELVKRKLITKQYYPHPSRVGKDNPFSWRQADTFGHNILPEDDDATAHQKAESKAKELGEVTWDEDDALTVTMKLPGVRRIKGHATFFNGLGGRWGMIKQRGAVDYPHIGRDGMKYLPPLYGDGSSIPIEYLDKVLKIQDDVTIYIPWQEGDILVLDNFKVQHAREPWSGEQHDRIILASLRDDGSKIDDF
ncbi:Clavaminate synthase-like protein [Wallemia mellicola]|nr:hypothetical protein E3Q23_00553 [Wallemia mellicola]TIC01232.1 Clavaminate synthase-like protein [Wallemia mellicola]TIC30570.1 Clavaminate synthase-like protein [Wallemia mellicola]